MQLSIIVPVYNMAEDERLAWCLESLVNQQTLDGAPLEDYEIIAVDDCSTDNSADVLRAYAEQYIEKVRVYFGDRNRHQGGAKNQALAHARGEWIAFIDADDWVTEDYFARLMAKAQETGADCVGTDYCIVHKHTMEPGPVVANSRVEQAGVVDEARRRLLLLDFGSLCVKIYRRRIVYGEMDFRGSGDGCPTRLAIFPEDIFYEDNAVAKTWVMRIHHFEYVPGPLYYYYQHDDSTVHTISLRRLMDRRTSGYLMLEEARRRGYLDAYRPEIEYAFTVLFYKNTLFGAMQSLKDEEVRNAAAAEAGAGAQDAPKSRHDRHRVAAPARDEGAAAADKSGPGAAGSENAGPGTAGERRFYRSVYDFVTDLACEMKETFPDFQNNPYYQDRTDAEEKKLIAMQMASPRRFYAYYRMLWFYRRIRYGRK